jgi:hypothetical protein
MKQCDRSLRSDEFEMWESEIIGTSTTNLKDSPTCRQTTEGLPSVRDRWTCRLHVVNCRDDVRREIFLRSQIEFEMQLDSRTPATSLQ